MSIDFDLINQNALVGLASLVCVWLPGGHLKGREYVAKNPNRPDDSVGSLSINVDTCLWSDFAVPGIGGNDPVSLYAFVFNLKQGEAAKKLQGELNIVPLKSIEAPKQQTNPWIPIVPVLPSAPPPPKEYCRKNGKNNGLKKYPIIEYYKYKTKKGDLAGYTFRIKNEHGKKEVLPLTYCKSGTKLSWRFKSWSTPRPIYKLDRLVANKTAQVLVVEGEKCADAATMLFENHSNIVPIAWIGGGKGVNNIKWLPLKNRKVIFWPDADSQKYENSHKNAGEERAFVDQPGPMAMIKIYNMVVRGVKGARIIVPPPPYRDGWDIADAIESGWDAEKVLDFIKNNIVDFDSLSQKPRKIAVNSVQQPFKCLGYNSNAKTIVYYYLPAGTLKVIELTANGHGKMNLLSLAPITYFEREYPAKNGADYMAAADDMIRHSEKSGLYDPLRCRGRGAWFDKGRTVLHIGNKLIVDGRECQIEDFDSYYIYEAEIPTENMDYFIREPLKVSESQKLIEITDMFSWEKSISSKLFAGWLVLAPICGAVDWRPHIWLTGESGTGKTWIQERVIPPILGKAVLNVSSNSTEAGIRMSLTNDAFPVTFDEAEAETKRASIRIQEIVELARKSSSNGMASIVKGSASGQAIAYVIRSCFLFASVNPSIDQQADVSRITLLKLVKRGDYEDGSKFDDLKNEVSEVLTDKFCAQLRARSITLIPTIRKNAEIFSTAMSRIFKSKRTGDQMGTLLAGAFSLRSDKVIGLGAALKWAESVNWDDGTVSDNAPDQNRCMEAILQQVVSIDSGGKTEAVGSLIRKAGRPRQATADVANDNEIENIRIAAREVLRKHGITTVLPCGSQSYYVAFACSHALLKRLLSETPWGTGYRHILMRHDGAEVKNAVFADKRRSAAILIPYWIIFPEDFEDEQSRF
ncbi:MAG: hypothetical protein KAI70_00515 [Candidatus Omnitrophica bacterium]|nr:hypothetical protein [Candidatus Omnitrophota bacterium]